jgi:hypothetical protein
VIPFPVAMAKMIRRPDEVGGGSDSRPIKAGADLVHPLPAAPADPSITIDDARRGRIVRDAEALLSFVARRDTPGRVAIVESAADGALGFSLGSGHRLAAVFNCTAEVAVGLDVAYLLGAACHKARSLNEAVADAAMFIESLGVHELAHAVTAKLDAQSRVATIPAHGLIDYATGKLAVEWSLRRWLRSHDTRWGAAYAILAARAMRCRPRCQREWLYLLRCDYRFHCLPPYDAFAAAVAGIGDDEPLRAILADKAWLATLPTLTPRSRLFMSRVPKTTWRTDP